MRKLLKLIIGVISSIILLMYLTLPFVKIGDDKYRVFEYIKYIQHAIGNPSEPISCVSTPISMF